METLDSWVQTDGLSRGSCKGPHKAGIGEGGGGSKLRFDVEVVEVAEANPVSSHTW